MPVDGCRIYKLFQTAQCCSRITLNLLDANDICVEQARKEGQTKGRERDEKEMNERKEQESEGRTKEK